MHVLKKLSTALLFALFSCIALGPIAHADDTEIFFGQSKDAFNTNPNVLFVLDTSGSMGGYDGGSNSRMDRMKIAMRVLLRESSSYNVGLMGFSGSSRGGSIHYPVGDLESDSGNFCPDGICPDERVVVKPATPADDATQNDDTTVVTLDATELSMAEITAAGDADGATRSAEISGSAFAVAVSAETEVGDTTNSRSITSSTRWFYNGTEGSGDDHYAYRFENIDIPHGAVVTSANITFSQTNAPAQVGELSALIKLEWTPDPEELPDASNGLTPIAARLITATSGIQWNNIPPEQTETGGGGMPTATTPDLSAIVNQIVTLPNWETGNPMSFILDPVDEYTPSAADIREFRGIDAVESQRPVLNYTYTTAVETDITTTVVEAVAHLDEITEQNVNVVSRNLANPKSRMFFAAATHFPRKVVYRFDGIDIPKDAEIQNAILVLNASADDSLEAPITDWTVDESTTTDTTGGTTSAATTATSGSTATTLGTGLTAGTNASSTDGTTAGVSETNSDGGGLTAGSDDTTPEPTDNVISFNIKAETTGTPLAYDSVIIKDRSFTSQFESWVDVDIVPGAELTSPNLATVITKVINPTTWTSGESISLLLEAPATYNNVSENSGLIDTATGLVPPKLHITWKAGSTVDTALKNSQTTAIRFANVHVPPQATIRSARLVFTASQASIGDTELEISAENSASSNPFSTTPNDLAVRQRTGEKVPWDVEPWDIPNQKYYSDDIKEVVQEVIDLTEWCGGNPLTIFLEKISGDDSRHAVSADQNEVAAPTLEITYGPETVEPGAYCSNATFLSSVRAGSEDGVQNMDTNEVDLDGSSLDSVRNGSGATQKIGLMFPSLGVPKDAVIVSATIDLVYEKQITQAQGYKFEAIKTIETPAFDNGLNKIISGNRVPYPLEVIATVQPGPAEEGVFRVDVAPLIAEKVSDEDWVPGKPLVITAEALSGIAQSFYSYETDEARAPQLVVYYQSQREKPGTLFRDNLIAIVDSMVAQSGTPIVGAFYEAAQYYTGSEIDYGLQRGSQNWQDRFHRVSHPLSYTSGSVFRASGCEDSNLSAGECTTERIFADGGPPTYTSPIESECQQNHIVLLSDGVPTSNTAAAKVRAKTGDNNCVGTWDRECGVELATWLNDTDIDAAIDGKQSVTTHTIGFNLTEPQFLVDIAAAGGGSFYSAESASELLNAFKNIFINVSKTDTSFVAPSATVSQTNRLKNRDDIYFSLFKPEGTARWAGNLKRYRLAGTEGNDADIVDVNNALAVDERTGRFFSTAKSYWSDVVDGDSVLLGGAAEQIETDGVSHEARNVYTYTGHDTDLTNGYTNDLLPGNTYLDREWFKLTDTLENDVDYVNNLINWAHGQDQFDIDGDSDTEEARGQMGDPMHSQPLLVNYSDGRSVVHVATNEGFLHAIDHATGHENFAFIPKELLPNLRRIYENQPTRNRPYGLDGGMTLWIDDVDNDGTVNPATDKAYLYIGMRRGGNLYYALDISNPDAPKYLWSIAGGANTFDSLDTTADGDFIELGDTWSKPIKTKIYDDNVERDVLIFGAGYGSNQDPVDDYEATTDDTTGGSDDAADGSDEADEDNRQTREEDTVGRGFFIVDARTGNHIWNTENAFFPEMKYSVPSALRVIDINFDGMADQIYFGDMGGQVWRFDYNNDSAITESVDNRMNGGRIARFAGDTPETARRFYYPPDIALVAIEGEQQLAVSIGSGWRAHPLDDVVEDRFYSFRMTQVYGAPTTADGDIRYPTVTELTTGMVDLSGTASAVRETSKAEKGWFLPMEAGEKVLSSSVTIDNSLIFTSYVPSSETSTCAAAIGSGAVYFLDLATGNPVKKLSGDENGEDTDATDGEGDDSEDAADFELDATDRRRRLAAPGIPPEVTVLFPEVGNATVFAGKDKVGVEVKTEKRRTFWQEHIEENL